MKTHSLMRGISGKSARVIPCTLGWVLACAAGHPVALGASPTAPTHLRVNDVANPVGTGNTPYFGWYVNDPDPNEIQTHFQILVSSSEAELAANNGDVWDSGEVSSRMQNHIRFSGNPLEGDRRYYWKVRTWDKDGALGPYSESTAFTVGLPGNPDWSGAAWIRRDTSDADDYSYFRKNVDLPDNVIERATAYISSAHKYELYVNGTRAGSGPAYHYPPYQYYNAYDITPLVTAGSTNQFAIFNHWFGGGQGRPANARGVIMKAVIHYRDGSAMVIGTDGTWRQTRAASWILHAGRNPGEGVGYIEEIDARRLEPDWNSPSFDDASWGAAAVIGAHPVSPWTGTLAPDLTRIEKRVISPVSITDRGDGKYMVDLGKVYAGVPRILFSGGASGDRVEMLGGYALDANGDIDTARSQSTDMRFFATLDGGSFTFEPTEYLGMRYFQISRAPMPVTATNFTFVARHSAMDPTLSSFRSPDATLNAVWDVMKHSLFLCAQEEFVDTPTREKGGFLGDAAIQSTVAMPVMNERVLTRRVLNEFLQSMDQYWTNATERGRMNAVYPNRDGKRDIPDYTQAYLPWAWAYYMETGDRDFLSDNYEKFKDIADYVNRYRDSTTGLITSLAGGSGAYQYGIVDWPSSMRFGYDMTAARTVINGWAYADNVVLARMADELGHTTDRDTYRGRADELKSAINGRLLNGSGVYVDGLNASGSQSAHVSQHANMFPLALGIVPPAQTATVADNVKDLEMSVGMVTLPWLVRAIGEADEGEHLIELFTNENWLGWARCLSRGATSTWESWYSDTSSGESLSHAWGAAGLEGYVRYILGISPTKPQYEEVRIKPLDFGARLFSAEGTIPTDRGPISVAWERHGGSFYRMDVNLPANATATVAVPRGTAANPQMYLDGASTPGTDDGNYIWLTGIGSGAHTILRTDTTPPEMGASLSEATLTLDWPNNYTDWRLQFRTNLIEGDWTEILRIDATNTYAVQTDLLPWNSAYFRLAFP